MEELNAIIVGIGLAASCGFRVFLPMFVASLAANTGIDAFGGFNFEDLLGESYQWLASTPVTITLGVATVVEIGSYYVPWIDNLLDTVASPSAVIAGTFLSGAMMPEFVGDGTFKWLVALVSGGGTAGIVQSATVITRGASSATTGGIGNPVVSTAELGGSIVTAVLAVVIPILCAIVVSILLFFVLRTIFRFFKKRKTPDPAV
ncbi:MAG: DUF4126 domain-containing protein [Opitutales bacterium]